MQSARGSGLPDSSLKRKGAVEQEEEDEKVCSIFTCDTLYPFVVLSDASTQIMLMSNACIVTTRQLAKAKEKRIATLTIAATLYQKLVVSVFTALVNSRVGGGCM